ncbi:MAG: Fur family transcriptional regulator [Proteobacteria bacterium]|jgi:Fur family zinc uptake transcriptional regulator|nr:Fur family transcriptional regulator [Pseudomonadota bacterium]
MKKKEKSISELNASISRVDEICRSNKLGFTDIRKLVFEIIIKNNKPIKAYQILDEIRNITNKPSHPPTVYRAIDFLIENGFVHKLNSINSFVGCFHPKTHEECYFLICKKCNLYQECCDDSLKDRISKTAIHNNFEISNTTLEIEGHCLDCSQK